MNISITDPIGRAYDRAILATFRPFKFGKWFVLGFIAWLASLGEGGGVNFNFNNSFRRPAAPAPRIPIPGQPMPQASPGQAHEVIAWITANLGLAIVIGLIVVILIVALSLLLTWISSRGRFMLLRAIATNTNEVSAPWTQYRELGNSLFGFRVYLVLAGFGIMLLAGGVGLVIAWPDIRSETFGSPAITGILVAALLWLPGGIIVGLIAWVMNNFVPVIMYAGNIKSFAAFAEFRHSILPGNVGSFVLFLLMQIVLSLGAVICTVLVGCVTCCIGFLPYISTVATLPLVIFLRSYPIYFLGQFDPKYAIIQDVPPPPTGGFPVVGVPMPPSYPPSPYTPPPYQPPQ